MADRTVCLIIVMCCFVLFGHTLGYGLTWLDDYYWLVLSKDFLADPSNLPKLFSMDAFLSPNGGGGFFRPALTLSFAADAILNGNQFFFSHLINLLLHSASAVLFYIFLKNIFSSRYAAALAAVIFAVCPASGVAVSWIPARNDSLLAIFVFLSLLGVKRFLYLPKKKYLFFYAICFFVSLLLKENAVVLPLLAALIFIFEKNSRHLKSMALFSFFPAAVYAALHFFSSIKAPEISILGTLKNCIYVPMLAGKALFPYDPVVAAPYGNLGGNILFSGIFVIFISAAVFVHFRKQGDRKNKLILFGLIWFILFLLPTLASSADIRARSFFSEHRLYLPFAGLIISSMQIILSFGRKRLFVPLACAYLAFAASVSYCHVSFYKDHYVFWQKTVQSYPAYARYIKHLAWQEAERNLYGAAAYYYNKSLEIEPFDYDARLSLADVYAGMGDYDAAEKEIAAAMQSSPEHEVCMERLAALRQKKLEISNEK